MERNIAEIKDWARGLMNRLMTNKTFARMMADSQTEMRCYQKDKIEQGFDDINIECGATRMVVIQEDSPYVLKIQYDNSVYDYGKNEVTIYQKATERGLEKYFAWVMKAFTLILPFEYRAKDSNEMIHSETKRDIYVMEKCDMDNDEMIQKSIDHAYHVWLNEEKLEDCQESLEKWEDECDEDYLSDQEAMLEYAEEEWGEAAWDVSEFLDSMYVNDCHSGNFGWRNGELVICNYAGYRINVRGVE